MLWSGSAGSVFGPCSGLLPRSLLSHPGHQRLQFPPINGTGEVLFVRFARSSTRQTRAFSVVGPSVWNWHCDCSPGFTLTHSTLAFKLLLLSVLQSRALLSSNLEEVLNKSMY